LLYEPEFDVEPITVALIGLVKAVFQIVISAYLEKTSMPKTK
jgi:hypothetical protein